MRPHEHLQTALSHREAALEAARVSVPFELVQAPVLADEPERAEELAAETTEEEEEG